MGSLWMTLIIYGDSERIEAKRFKDKDDGWTDRGKTLPASFTAAAVANAN